MTIMDQIINEVTTGELLAKEILVEFLVRMDVYNIWAEYSSGSNIIVNVFENPGKTTIVELRKHANGSFSVITLDSHFKFLKELAAANFAEACEITAHIFKHEADDLIENAPCFDGYTDHPFLRDKELIEYLKGLNSYDIPINAEVFNQSNYHDVFKSTDSLFGNIETVYDLGNGIWIEMFNSAFRLYTDSGDADILNTRDSIYLRAYVDDSCPAFSEGRNGDDVKTILIGNKEIRLSSHFANISFNDRVYRQLIVEGYPNQEKSILDYFKHNQSLHVVK